MSHLRRCVRHAHVQFLVARMLAKIIPRRACDFRACGLVLGVRGAIALLHTFWNKFVSPEMKEEVLKENPDDTKLFGEKIANDGEMAEKEVEEALWEVYGNAKGGILCLVLLQVPKNFGLVQIFCARPKIYLHIVAFTNILCQTKR